MISGRLKREVPLYLMVMPGVVLVAIFAYGPMFGIVIAFERYVPVRGVLRSAWVGLGNFRYMLSVPGVFQVLGNTVFIAVMKIVAGLAVPVVTALLLNEARSRPYKRAVQTIIYLPYFLSWVILAGIFIDLLSPSSGIVNRFLGLFGVKPIFFLGNWRVFPFTLVVTDTWKNFGFGTIIYLAALTGINPELYEAAVVDGANRWTQTRHITLPGIVTTIILMTALGLGNILNAGYEQVLNLYSPQVYRSGDILDTLVYRMGLLQGQYGVSTAIGLFKSVVSFGLIVLGYKLADRLAGYKVF